MRRAHQEIESVSGWLTTYGIKLRGARVQETAFGSGLVATKAIAHGDEPIIHVPAGMVLSLDFVWRQAEKDPQLEEVLLGLGSFAKSARGAILTFLLMQISATSPDMPTRIGLENPWTTYVQYLATETSLPTFWSDADRKYAAGTTLAPAVDAKLKSLEKEFTLLCSSVENIPWCAKHWLDPETGCLTIEDWKAVDAIWRSRAMEIPSHGLCMVPVADMANHAHGFRVNARTDVEHDTGDIRLLADTSEEIGVGQEVTITYGEEKGACEMLFSYGFLDEHMDRAESMFLDLPDPDDDPIFAAKKHIFECAPGFRIMYQMSSANVTWLGPFVWLMCINEEDGLDMAVVVNDDGQKKLQASWKGHELRSVVELEEALANDDSYDLFRLRAFSLVNRRVAEEKDSRYRALRDRESEPSLEEVDEKSQARHNADRLRKLEWEMLDKANDNFDRNIQWLCASKAVQRYFDGNQTADEEELDSVSEEGQLDVTADNDSLVISRRASLQADNAKSPTTVSFSAKSTDGKQ